MTDATPTLWQRLWYTRLSDVLRGRFDASLRWQTVVAKAELPAPIEHAIAQVVRRSRLWRQEKAEVAAELVAHFQDGLDAGRSPEELVSTFGEPHTAARLIRRAKKRGRPLVWHLWHYAWLTLAAVVAAYLAAGLYMLTGRAAIKTDYLAVINERAASVAEEERAWPLYRDALLAMGIHLAVPADATPAYKDAVEARPDDGNWPAAEQFLHDHADSLAKLRAAASRQHLGFVTATTFDAVESPQDREILGVVGAAPEQGAAAHECRTLGDRNTLYAVRLPELQLLRTAALLLANDTRRAALQGDGDTAFANVVAMFRISRHAEDKPFFVSLLIANWIQREACAVIRDVLSEHPTLWTDAQLRDLAHTIGAAKIDWRRGADGERAAFYDLMQRFYTDNGRGDGRLALRVSDVQNVFELLDEISGVADSRPTALSNDALATLVLPAANLIVASRKEMTDLYDRFMDRAIQEIETPLWAAAGSPTLMDEFLAAEQEAFGLRYLFVNLLFPAYQVTQRSTATTAGTRDGVLVGLALELYYRAHDEWPSALDELSPRWLPEVPVDRLTGNTLGYRIIEDRPLVYSFGVDGDDDGGRMPIDDRTGLPDATLASPTHFRGEPITDMARHDGDWVIWTTAPSDATTPANPQ